MENKIDSIFEIKIKQDKICSAFLLLQQKMEILKRQLQKVKAKQIQSPFASNQEKAQKFVQRVVFKHIQPINQKMLQHQHTLNNIKYNHQNLCHNMAEEFKEIGRDFENHINEMRSRMVCQQMKIKQDVEVHKIKIDQIQLRHKETLADIVRRQKDVQGKIDNVWDVIRSIRKNVDDLAVTGQPQKQSKKCLNFKHTQVRQIRQVKENAYRPTVSAKKNFDREQVSILKNNHALEKSIEYASLLNKVQELENKFKQFTNNVERQSQKVMTSKRKIATENSFQQFGTTQDIAKTIAENRKKHRSPNQSRFGRSSIKTEEQQLSVVIQPADDKHLKKLQHEIKKTSDKLSQINFKYTLMQENYEMILSKMAKISHIESSVNAKADEIQKTRVDLSTVNEIKMRYRKIDSFLQDIGEKYLEKDVYHKEYSSVRQTIRDIQAFINKLAKQDQIKIAFEFIQNKIKQIVLVLTDKFQGDRQGAINKVQQIKCLTCNKQIQHVHNRFNASNSQLFSRNVRKRNQRTTCKRVHTQDC